MRWRYSLSQPSSSASKVSCQAYRISSGYPAAAIIKCEFHPNSRYGFEAWQQQRRREGDDINSVLTPRVKSAVDAWPVFCIQSCKISSKTVQAGREGGTWSVRKMRNLECALRRDGGEYKLQRRFLMGVCPIVCIFRSRVKSHKLICTKRMADADVIALHGTSQNC